MVNDGMIACVVCSAKAAIFAGTSMGKDIGAGSSPTGWSAVLRCIAIMR